jgi:hypothetical protein
MWNSKTLEELAYRLPENAPSSLQDLPTELQLFTDGRIRIVYAPFGFVNPAAKVAIVGLTPGWQQARLAYQAAIDAIRHGASPIEAHRRRKSAATFAGLMRRNLIHMLDEAELHNHLGISSTADLFASPDLHATSALRVPVFYRDGEDYRGRNPKPTKHPVLVEMIEGMLVPELENVPEALIIPLGVAVSECLSHLCSHGQLEASRCLFDFPHPSGNNGHRIPQFEAAKLYLRARIRAWFDGGCAA